MRRILCLILALALVLSISVVAYAETVVYPEENEISETVIPGDSPQAEETCWYFRTTDDGLFQKRLWSLTYGRWLTDWITVGYVDP